jgi:hypothetical protein
MQVWNKSDSFQNLSASQWRGSKVHYLVKKHLLCVNKPQYCVVFLSLLWQSVLLWHKHRETKYGVVDFGFL